MLLIHCEYHVIHSSILLTLLTSNQVAPIGLVHYLMQNQFRKGAGVFHAFSNAAWTLQSLISSVMDVLRSGMLAAHLVITQHSLCLTQGRQGFIPNAYSSDSQTGGNITIFWG